MNNTDESMAPVAKRVLSTQVEKRANATVRERKRRLNKRKDMGPEAVEEEKKKSSKARADNRAKHRQADALRADALRAAAASFPILTDVEHPPFHLNGGVHPPPLPLSIAPLLDGVHPPPLLLSIAPLPNVANPPPLPLSIAPLLDVANPVLDASSSDAMIDILANHAAEKNELTTKADSLMDECERHKAENADLRRSLEEAKVELAAVATAAATAATTAATAAAAAAAHRSKMARQKKDATAVHANDISTAMTNHAAAMEKAKVDAKVETKNAVATLRKDLGERALQAKNNLEAMMKHFRPFVYAKRTGVANMKELLTVAEEYQTSKDGALSDIEITSFASIDWQDRFNKIDIHSTWLIQKIEPPHIYIPFFDKTIDDVVSELSKCLMLLDDPSTSTWINHLIIRHLIHSTNLDSFISTLQEQVFALKRSAKLNGKSSTIAKLSNELSNFFPMHRTVIHILALHLHLRLRIGQFFVDEDVDKVLNDDELIDLTSFSYSLIYVRDKEFSLDEAEDVRAPPGWRAKLNSEQRQLARNWCAFASAFKSELPKWCIDPSADLIKTLLIRYQYDKTTIESLSTIMNHKDVSTKVAQLRKDHLPLVAGGLRLFRKRPAEWFLRHLSIEILESFLKLVGTANSIQLYDSILKAQHALTSHKMLAPYHK